MGMESAKENHHRIVSNGHIIRQESSERRNIEYKKQSRIDSDTLFIQSQPL